MGHTTQGGYISVARNRMRLRFDSVWAQAGQSGCRRLASPTAWAVSSAHSPLRKHCKFLSAFGGVDFDAKFGWGTNKNWAPSKFDGLAVCCPFGCQPMPFGRPARELLRSMPDLVRIEGFVEWPGEPERWTLFPGEAVCPTVDLHSLLPPPDVDTEWLEPELPIPRPSLIPGLGGWGGGAGPRIGL